MRRGGGGVGIKWSGTDNKSAVVVVGVGGAGEGAWASRVGPTRVHTGTGAHTHTCPGLFSAAARGKHSQCQLACRLGGGGGSMGPGPGGWAPPSRHAPACSAQAGSGSTGPHPAPRGLRSPEGGSWWRSDAVGRWVGHAEPPPAGSRELIRPASRSPSQYSSAASWAHMTTSARPLECASVMMETTGWGAGKRRGAAGQDGRAGRGAARGGGGSQRAQRAIPSTNKTIKTRSNKRKKYEGQQTSREGGGVTDLRRPLCTAPPSSAPAQRGRKAASHRAIQLLKEHFRRRCAPPPQPADGRRGARTANFIHPDFWLGHRKARVENGTPSPGGCPPTLTTYSLHQEPKGGSTQKQHLFRRREQ